MRQYFFLGIVVFGLFAGIIYFCWSIVAELFHHWWMGKDVNKIKAESEIRRAKRTEEAEQRLDNGCDHAFGESYGGFPPNACPKCGLERKPPDGPCDHVWRLAHEAVPCSYCEKCGKKYVTPRTNG